MPVPPQFRHLYRGPKWRQVRSQILDRAQHCCERCGKPDGEQVLATANAWFDPVTRRWIRPAFHLVDRRPPVERGIFCPRPCGEATLKVAQLGVAHINHIPGDDRPKNLAAWCRECHLKFDFKRHAETRKERKDRARPLLTAALEVEVNDRSNHLQYYPAAGEVPSEVQ